MSAYASAKALHLFEVPAITHTNSKIESLMKMLYTIEDLTGRGLGVVLSTALRLYAFCRRVSFYKEYHQQAFDVYEPTKRKVKTSINTS